MRIDDIVKNVAGDEYEKGFEQFETVGEYEKRIERSNTVFDKLKEFLKTETGSGEIEEYINHPLNLNKSKALAHVLRGLTGILGNLNLAIVDILIGFVQYVKDKKGGV